MSASTICAPLPGIFYTCPGPERPPFKTAGDPVVAGEVIGLIEVMKSFIEVQADVAGRFGGYLVANEGTVDVDDALAAIHPV